MVTEQVALSAEGFKRRDFLRRGAVLAAVGVVTAGPVLAQAITADDVAADQWRAWNTVQKKAEALIFRHREIRKTLPDEVFSPYIVLGRDSAGYPIQCWAEADIRHYFGEFPIGYGGVVPGMKDGKLTMVRTAKSIAADERSLARHNAKVAGYVAQLDKAKTDAATRLEQSGLPRIESELYAMEEEREGAAAALEENSSASVVAIAARLHVVARWGVRCYASSCPAPGIVAMLKTLAPHLPTDMAEVITSDMAEEYDGKDAAGGAA